MSGACDCNDKRVVVCLAFAAHALAQVAPVIHYQRRLVQGTNLYNGTASLRLLLYTSAAGGVQIYEDTGTVSVVDGLYNTFLGDLTVLGTWPDVLTNQQL